MTSRSYEAGASILKLSERGSWRRPLSLPVSAYLGEYWLFPAAICAALAFAILSLLS